MPLRILRFAETVDGVTYTARTNIPKGARLVDILLETSVAWAAASADLDVGDSDGADSLITAQDMSTEIGLNAKSATAGSGWPTNGGPYSEPAAGKLYPTGDVITCVLTAGTPGGPTGLSSVVLWYEPQGSGQLAAVTT